MSKKYGIMDWYFQLWNLTRHVELYSEYRRDEIDILHLMDSKLHLPENIQTFNRILGLTTMRYREKYEQMQGNTSNQIVHSTCDEFRGFK